MATLILSTVGRVLGGPLGGALGGALGRTIDQSLFGKPKGTTGPQLKELEIQTSSYGTQIPRVLGRMRMAGTVFWATDIKETSKKEGGGKTRPSTTSYSYSASFAVALSSGEIGGVRRIWADGNLLRGADGAFTASTGFRLYTGTEHQNPDPLIAADVGIASCPAVRGIAYAVFEDMALADFGNRLPQLTFEIFERDGGISAAEIANVAAPGVFTGPSSAAVEGYLLEGANAADALAPLLSALPVSVGAVGRQLTFSEGTPLLPVPVQTLAAGANGRPLEFSMQQEIPSDLPDSVQLRYYDSGRDFQTGLQQDDLLPRRNNQRSLALPASLGADAAKGLAQNKLLALRAAAAPVEVHLLDPDGSIGVGTHIRLPGSDALYRVESCEIFAGFTRAKAVTAATGAPVAIGRGHTGQNWQQADAAPGETTLLLAELPAMTKEAADLPVLAVAAGGTSPGWRGASLFVDSGEGYDPLGDTPRRAVFGKLAQGLPFHPAAFVDKAGVISVTLLNEAMDLPAGTGNPADAAAPAIWLAGEIIRYASVQKTGVQEYEISGLLRGQFGTDRAVAEHEAGADMLLLERDSLFFLDGALGEQPQITIAALGIGDSEFVQGSLMPAQLSLQPLAPLHGRCDKLENGSIALNWIRRARVDDGWRDFVDQPNPEATETYSVQLLHQGNLLSEFTVHQPGLVLAAAEIANFPATGILEAAVYQTGTYARSAPLMIKIREG